MNLNDPRHPWSRLTVAARNLPDDRTTDASYGFATRVAALAMAQEVRMASLFDRFALRAVGIACLLALASVAVNYSALTKASSVEEEPMADDPVSVLLDV